MRSAWNRCGGSIVAALGIAAAAGSAHGVIIYQDVPDTTLTLPAGGDASQSAGLDFLDDGSNEFMLTLSRTGNTTAVTLGGTFQMARVFILESPPPVQADRFEAGESVGAVDLRSQMGTLYQFTVPGPTEIGQWRGPAVAFAGISIDGFLGPNFGWARIGVDVNPTNGTQSVTLFDFAFEGSARTPIVAGAVPGPGAISLGLIGGAIAARRRRR